MAPIMCRHFRAAKGYTSTFSHSIVRISFHASSAENNRPSSSLRHDPISWIRRFNAGPFRFPFRFILPSSNLRATRGIEYERISTGKQRIPEHCFCSVRLRFIPRVNCSKRELQSQFESNTLKLILKSESRIAPKGVESSIFWSFVIGTCIFY